MFKIKNTTIKNRLNYLLGGAVIIILFTTSAMSILYSFQSYSKILDNQIANELNNMDKIINIEFEEKQSALESSINLMSMIINNDKINIEKKNTIHTKGFNILTHEVADVVIPNIIYKSKSLYNDSLTTDWLGKTIKGQVIINARVPNGFIGIATNIKNEKGQRSINGFIPENSDVGKKLLSKNITYDQTKIMGIQYISANLPIIKDGEIIAVIIATVEENNMSLLKETIQSKKFLKTGYAYILEKEGKFLIHPDKSLIGLDVSKYDFYKTIVNSGKKEGKFKYDYKGKKWFFYKFNNILNSYIVANVPVSEYLASSKKATYVILIVLLLANVLFLFINRAIVRSIKKPLNKCVVFTNEIAKGNITATLDINQKDELGQLADSLKQMLDVLKKVMHGIISSSETIILSSRMVNKASQQISESSNEQASSIEEVVTTMEEMVSAIKENSQNAENTNKISHKAQNVMERLYKESTKLANSVNNISDKISIINGIAMQTNILSLNARVESSKAGTFGRGFGVVAEEIRNLADVSKNAADDILQLSSSSIDIAVNTGVQLNELMPRIQQTTELVDGITIASTQQYTGAEQVNSSMQQLSTAIQINASTSEELASSAFQLKDEVVKMRKLLAFFKI